MAEYEEEFPRIEGPPSIANYDGRKIFKNTKTKYTVEIDAGSHRMIWEMIEAEAKRKYPTRESMESVAALLRGVQAFRDAYWEQNEKPAPAKKATGRIVPTKRQRLAKGEEKSVRRVRVKGQAPTAAATPPAAPARSVRRIRPR